MSALWLMPALLAVVAVGLAWWSLRTVSEQADGLRRDLRAIPVLADRSRVVRAQAERTRGATDATGDYFGARLHK
ncbi:MAG: hypothetical protein ACXWA3_03345 [Acidimicrobiales bacterium]